MTSETIPHAELATVTGGTTQTSPTFNAELARMPGDPLRCPYEPSPTFPPSPGDYVARTYGPTRCASFTR